jgi:Tfp pilus assembly protein FimT
MTTAQQAPAPQREGWAAAHRWVIIGVLAVLAVIGLITYGFHQHDEQAKAKAQQLTEQLQSAGLRAPASQDTIVNLFGTDGGVVCDDPGGALRKALVDQQLVNGAANVGQRPVIGEVHLVKGATIVLQVYCPDKVDAFRDKVANYQLDNVVSN